MTSLDRQGKKEEKRERESWRAGKGSGMVRALGCGVIHAVDFGAGDCVRPPKNDQNQFASALFSFRGRVVVTAGPGGSLQEPSANR